MFLPQCERQSLTPIQKKNRQNYSSVYLNLSTPHAKLNNM
jgi:hypothetical protein